MKKLNTFLFDLDGTLLSINMKKFEEYYFHSLSHNFRDLMSPQDFVKLIWSSTMDMVKNVEHKTNEEVFKSSLRNLVDDKFDLFEDRFTKYYDTDFVAVREAVEETVEMVAAVKTLKSKGYNLAIATNPMFPKAAIYRRIEWAGLDLDDFSYITTFEENHYCKPQLQYYEEILRDIKKSAEECIMVGNDVLEDLVAKRLGIQTYLITDHMLNRNNIEIVTDQMGTYKDVLTFVESLPSRP
ncbi:MAG TPA: HAD family hydrolase [Clostridiaceae bacterium]|nr:HAD family hydrolase [Clostridiaceae bacterium]